MSENTGHGRIETRTCTVVSYGSIMEKMFKKKLVGLKSIVGIKSALQRLRIEFCADSVAVCILMSLPVFQ